MFMGRISLLDQPWLADHVVSGEVILPGAAYADLALSIGERLGFPVVDELINERPIRLPAAEPVWLQIYVAADGGGSRPITFHTSSTHPELGGEWHQCASGNLRVDDAAKPPRDASRPPARGSVDVEEVYARLAERGLEYGETFRGLRELTESGDRLYGVIDLPDAAGETTEFSIHPALLDAALHPIAHAREDLALPFSWNGIRRWSRDAEQVEVTVEPSGTGYSVVAVDPSGAPVFSIDEVTVRHIDTASVGVGAPRTPLCRVEWVEFHPSAERLDDDPDPIGILIADSSDWLADIGRTDSHDVAQSVHAVAERLLSSVQDWITHGDPESRLAVFTRQALAVSADDQVDLRLGAIPGFVRTVRAEMPGRIVHVDHDGSLENHELAVVAARAMDEGESDIAIRRGSTRVGRLSRDPLTAPTPEVDQPTSSSGDDQTALIIGGVGMLGRLAARALATTGRITDVILASRRGPDDEDAPDALAELTAIGLRAEVVACDATDAGQLSALINSVPASRPLTAVVHAAGALADMPAHKLTPAALHTVMTAKVDVAWNLHRLTEHCRLHTFVVFSSAAGTLGTAGQANYAAANTFLDSFAHWRRSQGLAASSLAWGLWGTSSDLTDHLGESDRRRLMNQGVRALDFDEGAAMLTRCLRAGRDAVPLGLARTEWQPAMSPMLRGVLRVSTPRRSASSKTSDHVRGASGEGRSRAVASVVRRQVAAVLGHPDETIVPDSSPFKELGLDSLAAVELRNRIAHELDVRLPATVVFDHPTVADLTTRVLGEFDEPAQRPVTNRSNTHDDPIVIVGMACRYPGGVRTPRDLWELSLRGDDAISGWPDDRGWSATGGSVHMGGFVDGMADFDAALFGMSPREALATDPQQRHLLEITWETLENAGINPQSLRGSNTGIYAGIMYNDYATRLSTIPADLEAFLINGSASSVASGRVAYTFGLQGPAVSVDTACSSSLVSIHLATSALRNGECDLALAGGVTLLSTPASMLAAERMGALSADGRCRSFADDATGTGWAEGIGMIALERLSDAHTNGHHILATIRGTAINQDGASNGLTAPNGRAQRDVITRALTDAHLTINDIDAVEAHGTGTPLGDPIEAEALIHTYGQRTPDHPALYIGSLKSNIGHTQAAAGVGGVIKMVQALTHHTLPASLHATHPNTHVDWTSGHVAILTESTPWPHTNHPPRAAVSAFGVSGTNAHLILEAPPTSADSSVQIEEEGPDSRPIVAWPVSGLTGPALTRQAARLAAHLSSDVSVDPGVAAHALATSRAALPHRAVVIGRDRAELAGELAAVADDAPTESSVVGTSHDHRGTVFVYPGHGAHWPAMAVSLLTTQPVFADTISRCAHALASHLDWDVEGYLRSGGQRLPGKTNVELDQPALWAVMMGLTALWGEMGVRPDTVIGHSQGEVAAACAAGILSLEEGARLVAVRSRQLARLVGRGAMASIALSSDDAAVLIRKVAPDVGIATINGDSAVVVSGEADGVDAVVERAGADGVRVRRLDAELAGHSVVIDALEDSLLSEIGEVRRTESAVTMISTVTGAVIKSADLDGRHWFNNLRETVRFHAAAQVAVDLGHNVFVEVSPHPVLTQPLDAMLEARSVTDGVVTGTLRRDDGDSRRLLLSAADLWVNGVNVDWAALNSSAKTAIPTSGQLPTYAFEPRRFWLDAEQEQQVLDDRTESADTEGVDAPVTTPSFGASLHGEDLTTEITQLVTTQIRAVLRMEEVDDFDDDTALKDLGFESVSVVDLMKRLSRATGHRLPSTLAFDCPTPEAIADHIRGLVEADRAQHVSALVDELTAALGWTEPDDDVRARLATLSGWSPGAADAADRNMSDATTDLEAASDDELFDMVDSGRSGL
nr:type I polyketide synthase [Gordonia effusa]